MTVGDNNTFSGTLKYVTGYTGFSSDTDLQKGHFIGVKVTAPEDATRTTIQLLGGLYGAVALDEDMNAVLRVTSPATQSIQVVTTVDGVDYANTYSLANVTLAPEANG